MTGPPAHCMVVHAEYPLGEVRVERQADALLAAGHPVDVICLRQPGQPARETVDGARVTRLPVRRDKRRGPLAQTGEYLAFLVMAFLVLAVRARRYRTVQLHAPPDAIVFAGLPNRLFGARLLLDVHDVSPEFGQVRFGVGPGHPAVRTLTRLERWSCRFADHVVTVSPHWRRVLEERTGVAGRCSVVPNLPGRRFFARPARPGPPAEDGSLRLVYHGTITSRYGLDVAVAAMAVLRDRGVAAELEIRGRGDVAPLRASVDELDLGDRVRFVLGLVPYEELAPILAGADLGIVPYRADVFTDGIVPTKLLEYAFLDLPAIASRTTGVTSMFDASTTALVPPEDPEAIADAVEALAHPEERARLREGLARFRATHDPERVAADYVGLIEAVAGSTGR